MATGKAPISVGFAIVCGLLAMITVIIATVDGGSWSTVVSALTTFAMTVVLWRGMKRHDREYQERMERLQRRLGPDRQ